MTSEELIVNVNCTKQCYRASLSTCQLILPRRFLDPTNSVWIYNTGWNFRWWGEKNAL